MGTNYYLEPTPPCECCNRSYPALHIGKSSVGWCFSLHVDPDNGINDLDDWEALWSKPGAVIRNEYGETLSVEDMRLVIMDRAREPQWHKPLPSLHGARTWAQFHESNFSEEGPAGLLRHAIGRYCVKHGAGTWDCIPGEFS